MYLFYLDALHVDVAAVVFHLHFQPSLVVVVVVTWNFLSFLSFFPISSSTMGEHRISSKNTLFIYNENCFTVAVVVPSPCQYVSPLLLHQPKREAKQKERERLSVGRIIKNRAWHKKGKVVVSSDKRSMTAFSQQQQQHSSLNNLPFYSLFHVINFYYTSFIFLACFLGFGACAFWNLHHHTMHHNNHSPQQARTSSSTTSDENVHFS